MILLDISSKESVIINLGLKPQMRTGPPVQTATWSQRAQWGLQGLGECLPVKKNSSSDASIILCLPHKAKM